MQTGDLVTSAVIVRYAQPMPARLMYVQLKTGVHKDRGPSWIAWVRCTRTWRTAYLHGRTVRRTAGAHFDSNAFDVDTGDECRLFGPGSTVAAARAPCFGAANSWRNSTSATRFGGLDLSTQRTRLRTSRERGAHGHRHCLSAASAGHPPDPSFAR